MTTLIPRVSFRNNLCNECLPPPHEYIIYSWGGGGGIHYITVVDHRSSVGRTHSHDQYIEYSLTMTVQRKLKKIELSKPNIKITYLSSSHETHHAQSRFWRSLQEQHHPALVVLLILLSVVLSGKSGTRVCKFAGSPAVAAPLYPHSVPPPLPLYPPESSYSASLEVSL